MKKLFSIILVAILVLSLSSCKKEKEDPSITIAASEISIGSASGSGNTVKFGINVDWTTSISYEGASTGWLEATASGSANKNAVISVQAKSANDTYSERKAIITISYSGKTHQVTVTQLQNDAIKIDGAGDKTVSVPAAGGEITVTIESNVTYDIDMSSQFWIKQPTKSKGLTSKQQKFTVDPNSSQSSRTGKVYFKSGVINVTLTFNQAGAI